MRGKSHTELLENEDLYKCLFWGSLAEHPKGFPVILFGGWKDDVLCDNSHHIQRVVIPFPPPLDVVEIILPISFPYDSFLHLELQGFVGSDGKVKSDFLTRGPQHKKEDRIIIYSDIGIANNIEVLHLLGCGEKQRVEKFDFVGGAWFADGRIFAANRELVENLLEVGERSAKIALYNRGGFWEKFSRE